VSATLSQPGLLGDTAIRDYSRKLQDFNSFAEPELRQLITDLRLRPGMRVLDAGCGTGESLNWLMEAVAPGGEVVGIDLSAPHLAAARARADACIQLFHADLLHPPFDPGSFDLIWSVNTLNHLHDPLRGVRTLSGLLRRGGRIAAGQSSLVPDMCFAWDSRLERVTNEAVRQYYHDRYNLDERALARVRALLGVLRQADLANVRTRTVMIERVSPVSATDEAYLLETLFRNTWGERLQPYLSADDYSQLQRTCDPNDSQYALRRVDFHFLQSFTLCVGELQ
jgi:SAM-dependent methyltransferase